MRRYDDYDYGDGKADYRVDSKQGADAWSALSPGHGGPQRSAVKTKDLVARSIRQRDVRKGARGSGWS